MYRNEVIIIRHIMLTLKVDLNTIPKIGTSQIINPDKQIEEYWVNSCHKCIY